MMTPTTRSWALTTVFLLLVSCSKEHQGSSENVEDDLDPTFVTTPENGLKRSSIEAAWRSGYRRPDVIDMHTHISADAIPEMARAMEENGLKVAVNLSGGTLGKTLETSKLMQDFLPNLYHFYNPDWRRLRTTEIGEDQAKALEIAVKQHGFKGLKISKALGLYLRTSDGERVPVDWKKLDPLWAKAAELDVPVAIHTGDPKAFWQPVTPKNERYEELVIHPRWSYADPEFPPREQLLEERESLLKRHPKTTFILVHFANNPENLDDVERILKTYPNVYVDTSARLGEIGRHPVEKVKKLFITYKDRILFGTDLGLSSGGIMLGSSGVEAPKFRDIKPFYDAHWRYFEGSETGIDHPTPIQGHWKINAIGLPDDVLQAIYHDNAVRLLKLGSKGKKRAK